MRYELVVRVAVLVVVAACGDNHASSAVSIDAPPVDSPQAEAPPPRTFTCDGVTGLSAPIAPCSPVAPCGTLVTSFIPPICHGGAFDDSPPRLWNDTVTGDARAACVFRPASTRPRPLVIALHGATGSADFIYYLTLLRAKAVAFDLVGDGTAGFVLAADQGRVLDNPNRYAAPGTRHDIYYRDLASPSTNPDVRSLDRLIDDLVGEGGIDPARIYVIGWSNGGFFAELYAIARHATPTPGGNRIAAAAIYSAADPFENITDTQSPSCALQALPQTGVPLYVMHRACDMIPCDASQQHDVFHAPPGFDAETWLGQTLPNKMGDGFVTDVILDDTGNQVSTCASTCMAEQGGVNHGHWPDGIADGGGIDWEPTMLGFLRDHPL